MSRYNNNSGGGGTTVIPINTPSQSRNQSFSTENKSSTSVEIPMTDQKLFNSQTIDLHRSNEDGVGGGGSIIGKHVHYDQNPTVFFLPVEKPTKSIEHNATNTTVSIIKGIVFPLILTFLVILIPLQTLTDGFLDNWVYCIAYIPCVTIITSIFHLGWAQAFIKGYHHYTPICVHTVLVTLTFSLLAQFSSTSSFPIPIQIFLVPLESLIVLPIFVYLRSSDRFKLGYSKLFLQYFIFLVLVTLAILLSIGFVIAFPVVGGFQIVLGIIYYIAIFIINHALIHITRKHTPRGTHNIICYWIESLSELVFCLLFLTIESLYFYLLLLIKVVVLARHPFFLSDRYWQWRNDIKSYYEKNQSNLFNKSFYGFLGFFLPVSIERDEHQTRVVDRFFFTCLSYIGVPLFYILISVCLRYGVTSQYYPYRYLEQTTFINYVIFSFFSSFFAFMMFLVIRFIFQNKFQLSVLNHPLQSLKNNSKLLMFCNFSALILPTTFMLLHNNVYYINHQIPFNSSSIIPI